MSAKTEAIASADAELNNADLPTYSELLAYIERQHRAFCRAGDDWAFNAKEARDLLARAKDAA